MNPILRYRAALGLLLVVSAPLAFGHGAFCTCKALDAARVRCTGGFIGGGAAPGVTLDVIGPDETILLHGELGPDSSLTFTRPDGPFYVLFDAGPGYVVEVDHTDIAP
ncbi:hypothetical protein [Pseudomonas sp. RIT-PI-AD]|uniref:hypothetical protein n=1 Tax=Pseudomonas sp. RIT-PI-AD TaxID=3035294 RepID=UPI0021D915DB|nr:hypothetical protein [Pseudomonas sp. RIT-PI-AD]